MRCVILAAGEAKRLLPMTKKIPKCLLKIGERPLLAVTMNNLLANNVRDIVMVTGFMGSKIRRFVQKDFPDARVTYVDNPRYSSTDNGFSLFLTRPFFHGQQLLLIDADLAFPGELLFRFLKTKRKPNRLAVRVLGPHDDEEIRVRINRWDHIREIGKHVRSEVTYGESIGIALFSPEGTERLFRILEARMKRPGGRREFYETSFQQFIDEGNRLWADAIGDLPAVEIDTPADLALANQRILPLVHNA